MKSPIFEMSADTRFIYQLLRDKKVGEIVTYEELTEATGKKKPVSGSTASLISARKKALSENGIVFDCIPKIGLVRLNDPEIVDAQTKRLAHIKRTSMRARKHLEAVEYGKLPSDKQIAHTTKMSILGVVSEFTTGKAVTKVEIAVSTTGRAGELPIADLLAAMGYRTKN